MAATDLLSLMSDRERVDPSFDCAPLIQKIWSTGDDVLLPARRGENNLIVYAFNELAPPPNVALICEGRSTRIAGLDGAKPLIRADDLSGFRIVDGQWSGPAPILECNTMSGCSFERMEAVRVTKTAFEVHSADDVVWKDASFNGYAPQTIGAGLSIASALRVRVLDSKCQYLNQGVHIGDPARPGSHGLITISGCWFERVAEEAVRFEGAVRGARIVDSYFERNGGPQAPDIRFLAKPTISYAAVRDSIFANPSWLLNNQSEPTPVDCRIAHSGNVYLTVEDNLAFLDNPRGDIPFVRQEGGAPANRVTVNRNRFRAGRTATYEDAAHSHPQQASVSIESNPASLLKDPAPPCP